jgi:hypothetical protein
MCVDVMLICDVAPLLFFLCCIAADVEVDVEVQDQIKLSAEGIQQTLVQAHTQKKPYDVVIMDAQVTTRITISTRERICAFRISLYRCMCVVSMACIICVSCAPLVSLLPYITGSCSWYYHRSY